MEKTISPGLKTTFLAGSFTAGIFGLIYTLVPEAYRIPAQDRCGNDEL